MTKMAKNKIKKGQFYGIITWGGALSGAWLIAKIVSIGNVYCTYEVPNGLGRVEKRKCKISDIYDAKDCALESIRNRPEYGS